MTARTVIGSNGKPRRLALAQPPHFRRGLVAPAAVDRAAEGAVQALRRSSSERGAHYYSTGSRPITTR